jgi:divalent metal cation (Fe/Co/Zn/Cd) transporter
MIPGFLAKVENMACLVPGLLGVHHLRADYIGPDTIHSGMHIVVQRGIPTEEGDRITEEVRDRAREAIILSSTWIRPE